MYLKKAHLKLPQLPRAVPEPSHILASWPYSFESEKWGMECGSTVEQLSSK
jgi:hypothetical protein